MPEPRPCSSAAIDFEATSNRLAVGGRLLDLRTPTTIYPDVYLPLHGGHQGDNAILALTAVETFFAAPLALDVVRRGSARSSCPAGSRCSVISRS